MQMHVDTDIVMLGWLSNAFEIIVLRWASNSI